MMNLIFDLDGTIGNTLPLCISAFREAVEPLAGRRLTDQEIVAHFGPSEEGTILALIPDRCQTGLERYLDCYRKRHAAYPDAFAGIPDILRFIRKRKRFLGLVTGKGPQSTRLTLEAYGLLNCFDCIKTGSRTGPVKKERIQEVLDETGLPRQDFFYVGDAPGDILAARACGIGAIAAAWAPTADPSLLQKHRPDYLFTTVDEFYDMLAAALPVGAEDENG